MQRIDAGVRLDLRERQQRDLRHLAVDRAALRIQVRRQTGLRRLRRGGVRGSAIRVDVGEGDPSARARPGNLL
ncbi:MAG: hypothetical protein NVS3B28_23560 [Candidatus Velthaea sp.]